MPTPFAFLRLAAKAVLTALCDQAAGDAAALLLPAVVRDIWNCWCQELNEEQRQSELQAIAQAKPEDIGQQVARIVDQVAADKPAAVRQALVSYLNCLPDTVRKSLGSVPHLSATQPQEVVLQGPEDLHRFLPARVPRLKLGDRPLAGVDLKLVQLLGVGGFGEVWKACNPDFDGVPPVALKFCSDQKSKDRLLRHEAAVLNQVMRQGKHPGIVPLLRTYLTADLPCLEYEYVEGGNLAPLIREWRQHKGGTGSTLAAKIILEVAEIVAFAHQLEPPIVHRDLKPSNILVQRLPARKILLRITDFGIGGLAASQTIEETTRHGVNQEQFITDTVRGAFTPLYASPQQMRGDPPDLRDDVFSLGVIWYQLLTGDLSTGRPGGKSWSKRLNERGVPPSLIELLAACFEDDPADRPANAAVFAAELASLLKAQRAAAPSGRTDLNPSYPDEPNDLAVQVHLTLQQVARAHEQARHLANQEHDYAAAAGALEAVPDHLRDATLYEMICHLRDRVGQLDREIREAVKTSRFAGLRVRVAALLELQPQRADLRRLHQVLAKEIGLPELITNSIGMKLALIPAGSFLMGSPELEEERSEREGPQHRVTLSKPFYMGIYPVTQQQYEAVLGLNPSHYSKVNGGGPDHPVDSVSWQDAVEFCKRLSELSGEKQAWREYRLPTEAEWEYACRAGTTTPFYFGKTLSSRQANFNGNFTYGGAPKGVYLLRTTKVGSYPPNAFGLYDTHGNLWEWCADYYDGRYYEYSPEKDPQGPKDGEHRIVRGGSWYTSGTYCRAAFRNKGALDKRVNYVGFRVVLAPGVLMP